MTPRHGVLLFHTDAAVFRAERLLQSAGLSVTLVPTPREFSSDCGLALRLEWARAEDAARVLREARVEVAALHAME